MILCEPFAGMVGVSFGTMGCKPPISWMGNKAGYYTAIANLLGLSRLNPPAAYVWGDVGPNIAALACLFGAAGSAEEVGRWLVHGSMCATGGGYSGPDPLRVSNWKPAVSISGLGARCESIGAPEVAAIIRGWRDEEPRALWSRLKAAGWPSLMMPEGSGGRWLGPQSVDEVANLLFVAMRSWSNYEIGHVYKDYEKHANNGTRGEPLPPIPVLADRVAALPTKPPMVACWQGRAEDMRLPERLDGWIMYVDGPYHGDGSRKVTGYKHGGCSRETQLALAAEWHRRGAVVAVSESVPLGKELSALTGHPWEAVDIGGERKGQARTFGNTQEWVTMNRPPVARPGVQGELWG